MDFKEIIKTNKNNVQNIIRKITNNYDEDIEQEVYIKVWQNSDKYEEKGSFKGWISTIAKNLSKDYLKSAYHRMFQTSTADDDTMNTICDNKPTPDNVFMSKLRQKRIKEAINQLPAKLKEVIILSEIEDLSYEQMAKKLNVPLGTVKSRIYNAKKELANKLQDLL